MYRLYLGCVTVLNQMQHLLKCYQHVQNGTLQQLDGQSGSIYIIALAV